MSLATAFAELHARVTQLEQALDNLLWAVVQGQPQQEPGHALIDYYEAAASDLAGLSQEARAAAARGLAAASTPQSVAGVRQALIAVQEQFNRLSGSYYQELVCFERLDGLSRLMRRNSSELARWAQGVSDALHRCPQPLYEVSQALFCCWQSLSERACPDAATSSTGAELRLVSSEKRMER